MGLLLNEYVNGDCILGCWRVEESVPELQSQIGLAPEEQAILESFQRNKRKLEWLSVRRLLRELCDRKVRICYWNNKPYLDNEQYHISISHSRERTYVLLSRSKKVGIDVEYISDKIERVAHRFLNEYEEPLQSEEAAERTYLYLHWCAKEAIYKLYNAKGMSFRHHITIFPFQVNEQGAFKGIVNINNREIPYNLYYRISGNYSLVWCCKSNTE